MTENKRTLTYIGLALVLLVGAAVVNRKPTVETEDTLAARVLFPELKSPDDVAGLQIETLDAGDNRLKVFKVAHEASGWVLPSHGGYPADAERQVASAAGSLIDLRALGVVSTLPSEHATYGVVMPDPEKAPPGAEGVGKLVTVLDKSGKSLARLVIGNRDKRSTDSDFSGGDELRFVRALPHDLVYRVKLPGEHFGTNFSDWIETDLLKLNSWDITEVALKDYSIDVVPDPATGRLGIDPEQKSRIKLRYDDKDQKWSLEELVIFDGDEPKKIELAADEELNSTRLNELRSALDDLKIVDVRPKPAGMSANLKAEQSIFGDRQAMQSLVERGFYPVPGEGGEPEILSGNGEVLVQMKDGVEYLLRFGEVAGIGTEEKDASKADEARDEKAGEDKETSLNRYIMVSARFNKDLIPPPELEPLPEGADAGKSEKKDEAADKKNDAKAGDAKKPVESKAAVKDDAGDADKAEDKKGLSPGEKEELALERLRIEKENERKQKEYDEKVKKGEAQARELNDRFAEWYYVVSESTYRKIHLNRADVIKKKAEEKDGGDSNETDSLTIPPLEKSATENDE